MSKSFGGSTGQVDVLQSVHLRVARGEFVAVTGPSGSGKTTLLNLAALLDHPSRGEIRFEGRPISGLSEEARCELRKRSIGMVFQAFHLLPHRTALENVLFRFRYMHLPPDEAREQAQLALDEVGLGALADQSARLLSGGEMQRVAIARAIAARPVLLAADEPTGNLDAAAALRVMEIFARLHREGMTVLLATHNAQLLRYSTRRVACVNGALEEWAA